MAEKESKFTEKIIQEKFLKYKRLSIEQINPELLTRRDLSFVDEFNNFKSKNNLTTNSNGKNDNNNKPSINITNKTNKNNYISSSINVLPQKNVGNNQIKKEKKKEKEENNNIKEIVHAEYSSNLLKLVSSGEDNYHKLDNKNEKNVSKKGNSTPEFNKMSNGNTQPDLFIDTLCSDNVKTVKSKTSKESKNNRGMSHNISKEEKKIKNENSINLNTNLNNKIDDDKNYNNPNDFIDGFGKKDNISKEHKLNEEEEKPTTIEKISSKLEIPHSIDNTRETIADVINLKDKGDEVLKLNEKINQINSDNSDNLINPFTEKTEQINENINIPLEKTSNGEFLKINSESNIIEIPNKENIEKQFDKTTDPSIEFMDSKIPFVKLEQDLGYNKKKETKSAFENDMYQVIERIKNDIVKGLERHFKGEVKNSLSYDFQKQFESIFKLVDVEIIKSYDKFPEILKRLIEIILSYEKKLEKRIEIKNILSVVIIMKDKIKEMQINVEDEEFIGHLKKILEYIICNIKIKQKYDYEKTTKIMHDFNMFCKDRENASVLELKDTCKEMLEFSHELYKFQKINDKMMNFFKQFKKKDYLTNSEAEKIISNLSTNYNHLSIKNIGKVAMEAIDLIVKQNKMANNLA